MPRKSPHILELSNQERNVLEAQTIGTRCRILLVWRPATSPPAARAFLALAREQLASPVGST